MTILGLDIGYDRCGFAIIENSTLINSGLINTNKKDVFNKRLHELKLDFEELNLKYNPDFVIIEKLFFHRKNPTFEKICMAKGVALSIFNNSVLEEIEPKKWKKEIIGDGNADKTQIIHIISKYLNQNLDGYVDDVIDAIALALYMNQKNKFISSY